MITEDVAVAGVAGAIGEPARARMLFCLLDGRARTSTELSLVAEVSPSTASAHLSRLKEAGLVKVLAQGKHRYYSLNGRDVGSALEHLAVLADRAHPGFAPSTPPRLRAARSCYDHMAGELGVALHDALLERGWLHAEADGETYRPTPSGREGLARLGIDVERLLAVRRRFAAPCLDWSERRPHLAGALGAALLDLCLAKGWVERELDGRALAVTASGRRALWERLGVRAAAEPEFA